VKEIIINDISELTDVAQQIVEKLAMQPKVFFYGEVGAGKTTLIKEICAQLELSTNTFGNTKGRNAP